MTIQSATHRAGEENKRVDTLEYAADLPPERPFGGDVLAPAFGMTVSAWIVAYITRMPVFPSPAPGQVTVLLMLAMVFVGGVLAARYSKKGALAGLLAGLLSGLLDILVIGSVLHDVAKSDAVAPAAGLWMGGSILFNGLVAGCGGLFGAMFASPNRAAIRWPAVFALILAVATLPLITAGGLVTAYGVGMAVPDWPQSYGYNMFLFPLSKMQSAQGNFYEHAHRLMGSLVGLTSLALAIYMTLAQRVKRVTLAAWCIFAAVCVQGLLGGLRVTEHSIPLATVHGIFAQIVLAAMACLAAASSRSFTEAPAKVPGSADRAFSVVLLVTLIVQLALGALVRQRVDSLVLVHVTLAAGVALLALGCGFRALAMHGTLPGMRPLKRAGIGVIVVVGLQLLLGIIALALRPATPESPKTTLSALWTTAHQANGALLLAVCAVLWVWNMRLFSSETPGSRAAID